MQGRFDSIWGANWAHRGTVLSHADIMTPGSFNNLAYKNLPEEVDDYAIQAQAETAIDNLIAPVAPTLQAQAPSVKSLKADVAPARNTLEEQIKAMKLKHVPLADRTGKVGALKTAHGQQVAAANVVATSAALTNIQADSMKKLLAAHAALIKQQG